MRQRQRIVNENRRCKAKFKHFEIRVESYGCLSEAHKGESREKYELLE